MIGSSSSLLDQSTTKPHKTQSTLRRLVGYFQPYWLILLVALVLLIASAGSQVIAPNLTGQAVDCYLTPAVATADDSTLGAHVSSTSDDGCWYDQLPDDASSSDYLAGLLRLVLLLAGLYVGVALASGLLAYIMARTGQRVIRQLQLALFARLQRLSLAYYDTHPFGDLMSRVTNDVSALQQAFSFGLVQVLSGSLLVVWIVITMFALNWVYGLISVVLVPAMALATLWLSDRARRAFRVTRTQIGAVNVELQQSFTDVREIQAFTQEAATVSQFEDVNAANRNANIQASAYTTALGPTLAALGYMELAIVAGVGGILMLSGQSVGGSVVSLGLIVAFIGYVQRFSRPIQQIGTLWGNLQSAVAGAERIFELLDTEQEIPQKPDAQDLPPVKGEIVFEKVSAGYVPGEDIIKNLSLTIEAGKSLAIVGPTGAGKSTLVDLIPRFYDVTGGAVRVDGTDIRDVTLESLRRQIGIVLQDIILFSDTVRNNIRFGRPDATDDDVVAAAKLAHADDFILRLPQGYDTVLSDHGGGLSEGQRQLISIARAALANPRLLILDEATSSVDSRTEQQIQSALDNLMRGRTSVVIAHRLSTIQNADRVLVLVKGEIAELGTHAELMARRGVYYDLYKSQFSELADAATPPSTISEETTSAS